MANSAAESEGNNNTGGSLPPVSVSPYQSGEGLPYAPVNWPNVGDNWKWSVGKRIDRQGFYSDRYLIAPPYFKRYGDKKPHFGSQSSLRRYLESEFPDADINAFFASFTWKIPTQMQSQEEYKVTPKPLKVHKVDAKKAGREASGNKPAQKRYIFRRRTRGYLKQFSCSNPANDKATVDLGSTSDLSEESIMAIQDSCGCSIINSENCQLTDSDFSSPQPLQRSQDVAIIEDFDDYLSSLDEILAPPPPPHEHQCPSPVVESKEDKANARKKLSGFLGMDLHALFSSKQLISEITGLSSEIRNDSSLSTLDHYILHLIDEIPEASKALEEIKRVEGAVGKYYADLEANVSMATNLRNEYKESQEKTAQLQAQLDFLSPSIEDIDEQIRVLQSRKAELTCATEKLKGEMAYFTSKQKLAVECLPKLVRQVQLSRLERSEWELKKKNAAEQEAKILDKFAPLKMFRSENS